MYCITTSDEMNVVTEVQNSHVIVRKIKMKPFKPLSHNVEISVIIASKVPTAYIRLGHLLEMRYIALTSVC